MNPSRADASDKPLRDAICTCTLISGEGIKLLVDPSLPAKAEMAKELDRRTGLKPDDITTVFVTHEHADHFAGLANIIVPGHDNYFLASS
jgi:glyoxylase-like metal-dependent hydrolase (beta-lactamase superfamily II)